MSKVFKLNGSLKVLLLLIIVSNYTYAQQRYTEILQNNWKFIKGDPSEAKEISANTSDWENVSIPHDWAIKEDFIEEGDGDTGKLPWKGQAWYRRDLDLSAIKNGNKVFLMFDGVMAFPKVYINGELAGQWDYGYNSFYLDVTDKLDYSENAKNVLAIHVDTRKHDSRWYPGAGIYRKVSLISMASIHTKIWGTQVTTPIIKSNYADVRISSLVKNETSEAKKITVTQRILNPEGNEVSSKSISHDLRAGEENYFEVNAQLIDPMRWDIEHPHLYKAITEVSVDEKIINVSETTFGIRSIEFTPDDGFQLNGRRVQLKGVNLHHGHGPLGAAFYPRAMERQLEIMKSMGVNAIRSSHNTAAPEVLELCDKMGILMFNEVFDKYDRKADIVDTTNFESFAERNIRNFVMRDRNHPSVFIWSVGNEMHDVQANYNNGFKRLHTMLNYVRKYDHTRPVTMVNDVMDNAALRHFDFYDVHSWNYGRRYRLARQMEPNKSVIISESASTVSTRGFYEFPLPEKKTDFTKSLQVSSYDFHAPDWAEIGDDDFMWQQDEPYIAGEFVWTGFDYLGEPTPYTNKNVKAMGMSDKEAARSSYFGIVDIVGIPKDRYYLYKSYWKPEEKTIHILPHWNWKGKEGENVPVFVYTNGDCAELFINGESQGKQCKSPSSKNSTERFRLMWKDVVYQPGEIKVVAYKQGEKLGEKTIKTTSEATKIKLSADRKTIKANGMDLSYVLVEAFDKDGNLDPLANQSLQIEVSGAGELAGAGNGDPQSFEPLQDHKVDLFYGKAMIILKSGMEAGTIKLKVSSENLKGETIKIETEK
jgi:beta-galactosidase